MCQKRLPQGPIALAHVALAIEPSLLDIRVIRHSGENPIKGEQPRPKNRVSLGISNQDLIDDFRRRVGLGTPTVDIEPHHTLQRVTQTGPRIGLLSINMEPCF